MFQKNILFIYKIWLVLSLVVWHVYFFLQQNFMPLYVDLLFITMYFGYRKWKSGTLPEWVHTSKGYIVYFVVAYSMVLIEEFYAALINHLNEGFELSIFFIRIGQFWAFNLLAFSGLIIGIAVSYKWGLIKKQEAIIMVSLFGLYSEHVFTYVISNWIAALVYSPIVILIYYLIFAPGISFLPNKEDATVKNIPKVFRYILTVFIIYVITIPFISGLVSLRKNTPIIFPPCNMITC